MPEKPVPADIAQAFSEPKKQGNTAFADSPVTLEKQFWIGF
jgi:hypothetical protein